MQPLVPDGISLTLKSDNGLGNNSFSSYIDPGAECGLESRAKQDRMGAGCCHL